MTTPRPPTIIIADDQRGDRVLFRRTFLAAHPEWRVVELSDGDQLVPWVRTHGRPDLVVLDIDMPRMDGLSALAALRREAAGATLPVIMLSNNFQDDAIRRCYAAGANSYMVKPGDVASLRRMIGLIRDDWFGLVAHG